MKFCDCGLFFFVFGGGGGDTALVLPAHFFLIFNGV